MKEQGQAPGRTAAECDHAPTVSQLRCPCGQFTVDAAVAWPQQVVDLERQLADEKGITDTAIRHMENTERERDALQRRIDEEIKAGRILG